MTTEAFGKLLGDGRWVGRIFNGKWVPAKGGTRDVPEPATGKPLCNVGFADASGISPLLLGRAVLARRGGHIELVAQR